MSDELGEKLRSYYHYFAQNVLLPVYDLVRGTSRFRYGRILDKTQWLAPKDIASLQLKNLRRIVNHAYETVPYYRRVFKKRGMKPFDIKNIADLVKLPMLTKKEVRTNRNRLVSRSFPMNKLVPYRSGASGDQLDFYVTQNQLSWEIAAEFRAYGWAGYSFGDRCALFWGSPIDLARYASLVKRITRGLERILLWNTFAVSDEIFENCARTLKRFDPEIVRGYSSSVYMMAKYMLKEGIDYVKPRAVITSAETLFPSMRKTIEEAFNSHVFDYYGSREVGGLAAQCGEHEGYHISAENVVLEFVKDGEHVAAGENGQMLVTSLRNFGMPFIRYRIGDIGKPSDEICSCGRGLPLLSAIEGRISDFMAVYDKRLGHIVPIGPVYPIVLYAMMSIPARDVRVVQESLDRIVVRVVKGEHYSRDHTTLIVGNLQKFLGTDITVEVEFADSLPPLPSGKRSAFVSKVNAFEGK